MYREGGHAMMMMDTLTLMIVTSITALEKRVGNEGEEEREENKMEEEEGDRHPEGETMFK
tara:strand:+ start:200 stop:379 length:180 start_codon:yes stop_codon:yes gene_type:complete